MSVPINKEGIEESNNIKVIPLSDSEFEELYQEGGVFDRINRKYDLMIDDFESETITNEELDYCFQ